MNKAERELKKLADFNKPPAPGRSKTVDNTVQKVVDLMNLTASQERAPPPARKTKKEQEKTASLRTRKTAWEPFWMSKH